MGRWYHFRNKLFVKIMIVFTAITVVTIATLSYFAYTFISESIIRNELDKQKQALEQVGGYLESKYDSVQAIIQNMYKEPQLADQVTYMLKNSYLEYIQYRLDQFSLAGSIASKGLNYFKEMLDDEPDMEEMILYSTDQHFLYSLGKSSSPKLIETNAARSYIPDAMAMSESSVSVPNIWVRKALNQWDNGLYSIRSSINDVGTMKSVGQLLVYFRSDQIERMLSDRKQGFKGSILVLAPEGQVIFDSSSRFNGQAYPYFNKLNMITGSGMLDELSYITTLTPNNLGYIVVGITPKSELAESYEALKRLILLIGMACIALAVMIPSLVVANYAKRTNNIIRFMRKVETGELGMRIPDTKEDELGQIATSFNRMLNELSLHIDRVYKAEIKQKHTELVALQARIHPHFLYNTLEVIRMRALSIGATDVGEMIYSLAVLFKSFVRDQTFISLQEEVELCRQYLELFRIRYKDKFRYELEIPPEMANIQTVKMSLQPLVENYIVHGMRTEDDDNEISIRAERADGDVRIIITDNGKGISPEGLETIRRALQHPDAQDNSHSLGVRSVNERLKLTYGKPYGVGIQSEPGIGTTVTVRFPMQREEENNDVSSDDRR
jgi:two-component system sensor histidine kinase YesM